jgi:NTE family protein
VVLVLGACSTTKPWINQPSTGNFHRVKKRPGTRAAPIIAAVTLSGGGARAAAFGLGVLQELKATRFEVDGRDTTMLDEVGLISGVSGGSILAAYYGRVR